MDAKAYLFAIYETELHLEALKAQGKADTPKYCALLESLEHLYYHCPHLKWHYRNFSAVKQMVTEIEAGQNPNDPVWLNRYFLRSR